METLLCWPMKHLNVSTKYKPDTVEISDSLLSTFTTKSVEVVNVFKSYTVISFVKKNLVYQILFISTIQSTYELVFNYSVFLITND